MLLDPAWPEWQWEPEDRTTILGDPHATGYGGWCQTHPLWYWRFGRLWRPQRLLEIGVMQGGSIIAIAVGALPWKRMDVVGIEIDAEVLDLARKRLWHRFGAALNFHGIVGDSMAPEVQLAAEDWSITNGLFDMAHIDACSSGDNTTRDLQTAWGVVRPGGIIIGHDTHHMRGDLLECGPAWDAFIAEHEPEIAWRRDVTELEPDEEPPPPGITIIQKMEAMREHSAGSPVD